MSNNFELEPVIVKLREVYGVERIYPVNDNAQRFADLAGKKTLHRTDLSTIRALGFQVINQTVTL